jgi:cyclopropane-fatty-acyl-phospholipid synthase
MAEALDSQRVAPHGEIANKRFRLICELLTDSGTVFEVEFPDGRVMSSGKGSPAFRLKINTDDAFQGGFSELAIAEAYINGEFDIEGDMGSAMDTRAHFRDALNWKILLKYWSTFVFSSRTHSNKKAIDFHYSFGDDFYLSFIDRRYRFYSHGLFHKEDETLEDASEHKLEKMFEALDLKPGMRLLDIGSGWGGLTQYCGRRGIHVTALTIADDSYAFIKNLIERENLPAEVLLEDFLKHQPAESYDAIVIFGVIEHLPDYRRFFERTWACLKPDGRLYLDASASREKFDVSMFTRRYIWPGPHTFLCLQDLIKELLLYGMDLVEVKNESADYYLTMRHWAERLDEHRNEIIRRWDERLYRTFRIYLWGGALSFAHGDLQAYHVVAQRRLDPGRRPGLIRRTVQFAREFI